MAYYVSRQRYYPSQELAIEIAPGRKNAGKDILSFKYDGEDKNLVDPRDAVNIAIRIYKQWDLYQSLTEKVYLNITHPGGGKFTLDKTGIVKAQKWAEKEYQNSAKCGACQRLLGSNSKKIINFKNLDGAYCSEYCLVNKHKQVYGKAPDQKELDKIINPPDKVNILNKKP